MSEGGSPIRVAVVGTGAISQVVHIPMMVERYDVDVAVLADEDPHKARTLAERFGIPDVVEPEVALTREDVDGVLICTPNGVHEDMAIGALEAGKHVFVERPIATSSAGAQRVVDAARAAGRSLTVGMPHRFRPEVTALRSFVAGGELGPLYAVRGSWLTRKAPITRPTWRQDRDAAGGGALIDLGVPALDLCLWIVGYPEIHRVFCRTWTGDHEVEDAATLLFEAEGGVTFTVEVSNRLFAGEDRYYARVMGEDGSGSLPPLSVHKQLGGRPIDVTPRQPRPRGGESPYMNAYRRLLDQFVREAAGRSNPDMSDDHVRLMRLVEAAYESAATGAEVTL